jgi:ribonuclease T2
LTRKIEFERSGVARAVGVRPLATFVLLFLVASVGAAQERQAGEPGRFDYYVLALSWSPSYCAAAAERGRGRAAEQQCGTRPYAFVVHGLWPQYERGYPENCQVPPPRLARNIVSEMLDLMPSPRLIYHEWDAHGTCSGQDPRTYFATIRKARAKVTIPDEYAHLRGYITVTPGEVESAFLRVNQGLPRSGIVVTCNRRRLSEIRVCLTRDLQFRDCSSGERSACRRDRIVMPPVRGG